MLSRVLLLSLLLSCIGGNNANLHSSLNDESVDDSELELIYRQKFIGKDRRAMGTCGSLIIKNDKIYSPNWGTHSVLVYDMNLNVIADHIYNKTFSTNTVNPPFTGLAFSDSEAYLISPSEQTIFVFDSESFEFKRKIGSSGTGNGQFLKPRGIAVDSAGRIYLYDEDRSDIQVLDQQGNFILKFGSAGSLDGEFTGNAHLHISDDQGRIYVTERSNHRVQVFDLSGNFIFNFGTNGANDGEFDTPTSSSISSSGEIFVSDSVNKRVQVFNSSTGLFLRKFSMYEGQNPRVSVWDRLRTLAVSDNGSVFTCQADSDNTIKKYSTIGNYLRAAHDSSDDDEFRVLEDIDVNNDGEIVVADLGKNQIVKFDKRGEVSWRIGRLDFSSGSGDGEFNVPTDIEFDNQGNIYVADRQNHRVQVFDKDGNFQFKFGSLGTLDGEFNQAGGIAVEPDGSRIYVVDRTNKRVQVFDGAGNFLFKFSSPGVNQGELDLPERIAIDDDKIYVTDDGKDKIEVFDKTGGSLFNFGESGSGPEHLDQPWGIDVDESRIYIADANATNYVRVFDKSGVFIKAIYGSAFSRDSHFWNPFGIAVNDNLLLVSDTNNNRILFFDKATLEEIKMIDELYSK